MHDREKVINPRPIEEDQEYELRLRPERLDDFPGQETTKEKLRISIEAAKQRGEPLDHLLFCGPPGLGKTTLAYIVAKEMGVNIKATSGPVIERQADLSALLTGLEPSDIMFIDEVHRLNHVVEEMLYGAMEDYRVDIMLGKGPTARSIKLSLAPFTLIGATTRTGLLTAPLRARFGDTSRLSFYTVDDLTTIVKRSAKVLDVEIDEDGACEIARRSRGTPRIANRLLRRIRDYAQVKGDGRVNATIADKALKMLDVDERGLDHMDKAIISTIMDKFSGGPVGVNSLAVAVGEEADTIEEVYEPFLIQAGYIKRTPSGRVATELAHKHFRMIPPIKQGDLWSNTDAAPDSAQ
jgi:Holliday junction DNA helicase RuvB